MAQTRRLEVNICGEPASLSAREGADEEKLLRIVQYLNILADELKRSRPGHVPGKTQLLYAAVNACNALIDREDALKASHAEAAALNEKITTLSTRLQTETEVYRKLKARLDKSEAELAKTKSELKQFVDEFGK